MNQNSWIYIVVALVVIVVVGVVLKNAKPKKVERSNIDLNKLMEAIGGKDNLISCEARGSKVIFNLVNSKLASQQLLTELGASGIVETRNKITVIFGKVSDVLIAEIEQM